MSIFIPLWIAGAAVYVIFAVRVSLEELVAAGLAGFCVAMALRRVKGQITPRYRYRAAWIRILLKRVPIKALKDCLTVLKVALRGVFLREIIEGDLVSIPFNTGGEDPESRARRALVVSGVCFSPNSVAVMIDREKGFLLVHQLEKIGPFPDDKDWPL